MLGLRVAARARAGDGPARGRQRGLGGRRGAAERHAGAPGRGAAALHGAVRRQRQPHSPTAHRYSPAADGHDACKNGKYMILCRCFKYEQNDILNEPRADRPKLAVFGLSSFFEV